MKSGRWCVGFMRAAAMAAKPRHPVGAGRMVQAAAVTAKPFEFCAKQMGKKKLSDAIKHNRRTIPCKNADARRSHLNRILAGPLSAAEVMPLAESLVKTAGAKLRKNASWGIEIICSLAPDHGLDQNAYFQRCYEWTAERFGIENILSVDVHLDEAAPHCHVLILPLRAGKLDASAILGGIANLYALRADFATKVQNTLAVSTAKSPLGVSPNKLSESYVLLGHCPTNQRSEPQTPSALHWLREKLARIQSVKKLELEAAQIGFSVADLSAARLAIGGVRVVPILGVEYWQLPTLDEDQKRHRQLIAIRAAA